MSVERQIQVAIVQVDMFIESALPLIRNIAISLAAGIAVLICINIMRRDHGKKKNHRY